MKQNDPDIVYHYCNLPVFISILENSTIRLTDKCYDILKLRSFYSSDENLEPTYQILSTVNLSQPEIEDAVRSVKKHLDDIVVYACCFSLYGDCSKDWHYADEGNGISLGLSTAALQSLSPYLKFGYVSPIQSSRYIALPLYEEITNDIAEEFTVSCTAFAKFDGDPEERSFRLVYIGSKAKGIDEIADFAHAQGAMVNRDGDAVPYFDMKLPMESILKEITVGPRCNREEVKALLARFGIDQSNVKVSYSQV